jgi:hypothetical protein
MGYSGRYHAASLAAVFIALAIGILIGIGLADDVVSSASQELENSLRDERDAARDQAADLQSELDQELQFGEDATRALIGGRLKGESAAIVYVGAAPGDDQRDIGDAAAGAIADAGGKLASVSSIPLPPDVASLADAAGKRFAKAKRDPIALRNLGRQIGARLVTGGAFVEKVKPSLFSTFNGSLEDVTYFVLVSNPPDDLTGEEKARADAFERGLLEGILGAATGTVGAETTGTDPTTLGTFMAAGVSTVDDVDRPAGEVALVYALTGASGDFGVKDDADSLIPQPLLPRLDDGR